MEKVGEILARQTSGSLTISKEPKLSSESSSLILAMANMKNKEFIPGELRLWSIGLAGEKPSDIEHAFAEWMRTDGEYFPTPAQILALIERRVENQRFDRDSYKALTDAERAECDKDRQGYFESDEYRQFVERVSVRASDAETKPA